jgi:hypothetical protein
MREVLNPQPVSWDEAAVELYRAERRTRGILPYPSYFYGLVAAARTARAAGQPGFAALEFGVAGGNGLRALETHAEHIERRFGVRVSTVGFDSGEGMLQESDPLDSTFAFRPGDFRMDEAKLRASLRRSQLVLGRVEETVGPFLASPEGRTLPPIGFVSIDLDVYTGTLAALDAISADVSRLLPRVTMHFDDLTGYPYTTETGEWAAIRDFNARGALRIGQIANLEYQLGGTARMQNWPRHMFVLHVFDHPDYDRPEQTRMPDTSLRA